MESYLKVLSHGFISVDYDVKFFLVKLLQSYNIDDVLQIPVKQYKTIFGVTDRVVTKSLKCLLEKEVLALQVKYGGKGRPCNSYIFTDSFRAKLKNEAGNNCCHPELIGLLLLKNVGSKQGSNKLIEKTYSIGLPTRVLLIVMLYHSNINGVLSDLSASELADTSGLSLDSVKNNIRKLKAKRYVRCSVGGIPKNLIFNKAYSHYFLNLTYIKSSSGVRSIVILDPVMRLSESARILRCARSSKEIEPINGKSALFDCVYTRNRWSKADLQKILPLFNVGYKHRLNEYLQLRLQGYASALLSDDWCKLDEKFISANIQGRIRLDITHHKEEGGSDASMALLLSEFIYDVSLNLAIFARRNILDIATNEKVNFSLMRHVIIPQVQKKDHSRGFVVESFYNAKKIRGELPTVYLYKGRKGFSELSAEELIGFNLVGV